MIILGVESSASAASVAVFKDDKLISEVFCNTGLTHSQTLMPMISKCLKNCSLTVDDIDKIAVSVGPGSFTGIRIGVATVKGIAFTKNIPCVPVSTLESMSKNISSFDGIVCCVMDARCQQVYNALFENGKRITDDRAISLEDLKNEIVKCNKNVLLVGDGADICYKYLKDSVQHLNMAPKSIIMQRASGVIMSCFDKEPVSAASLVPVYLRLPQAQRELNARKSILKENDK